MTSSLRDKLMQNGKVPFATVEVVGDDGQPITVLVRGLTQGARGNLITMATRAVVGDNREKETTVDMGVMQPQLIIACACDPETQKPLFTQEDLESLNALNASFLDPIVEKATELSGLSKGGVESAVKNS